MLQFAVANLLHNEITFETPSLLGKWDFIRAPRYAELLSAISKGRCANTFFASLRGIAPNSSDSELIGACDEIVDICLVLSFLTARCVTPSGTTAQSDIQFVQFGGTFVRARAIEGFPELRPPSLTQFFANWLAGGYPSYQNRRLRLQLCHWLSGITCFSLEDIYLSAGVQMDIVKQCERSATGNPCLTYFQGMTSASSRYSLVPLRDDYKNMRDDIVHEGVLSGRNFSGRSKSECAAVVADTLNWLDAYVLAVIGQPSTPGLSRWSGPALAHGLPAISLK